MCWRFPCALRVAFMMIFIMTAADGLGGGLMEVLSCAKQTRMDCANFIRCIKTAASANPQPPAPQTAAARYPPAPKQKTAPPPAFSQRADPAAAWQPYDPAFSRAIADAIERS